MKKLMFALVSVASVAALALGQEDLAFTNKVDFESYPLTEGVFTGLSGLTDTGDDTGSASDSKWLYDGTEDGSTVKAYGGDNLSAPTGTSLSGTPGNNYLELATEGGTLWRSVNGLTDINTLGAAKEVPATGLYVDTMVQFTPTEDSEPTVGENDKLAIWLAVDSEQNTTNLMVKAKSWGWVDETLDVSDRVYALKKADNSALTVDPGTWYRLTVKAVQSALTADGNVGLGIIPCFQIYLDGVALKATDAPMTAALLTALEGQDGFISSAMLALAQNSELIPSLQGSPEKLSSVSLAGVGFQGTGAIDDLVITENDLFPAPAESIDFTLTMADGVTAEYSTDNSTWTKYALGNKKAPAGTLYVRLTNGDGAQKVVQKSLNSENHVFDVSDEAFGWVEYLGAAIDGAYTVDNYDDLVLFQKGVAAGLATADTAFKLTADIDMDDQPAWDGIADGTHKFAGVFDGGNHTVTNLLFARATEGSYEHGFFNHVTGTIKNLKVHSLGYNDYAKEFWVGGGIIVGYLVGGTIDSCVSMGVLGTDSEPVTKNAGGIVCMVKDGALVTNCVNYANLVCSYGKTGGICCFSSGDATSATATFSDCVNYGNLKTDTVWDSAKSYMSWTAGIVAYSQTPLVIDNCQNFGTLVATGDTDTLAGGNVHIGQFLGYSSGTITFTGTNSGKTTYPAVGNTTDLAFATVADNIATFVTPVDGGEYKVMVAGAPYVFDAIGDTLTLDETLATAALSTTAEDAYVAGPVDGVYTVTAKTTPAITITLDSTEAEWTDSLALPEAMVTVAGDLPYTGSWDAAIAEPANAATTNVYTYTVNVAATDSTLANSATATFKVYKAAAASYPTYVGDDAAKKAKFDAWVTAYNGGDRDTASANGDAYLLNCAPANVDTAKTEFTITSIAYVNGAWEVKVAGNKGDHDTYGNGTIEIRGCATLDGTYAYPAPADAKFFKAFLK